MTILDDREKNCGPRPSKSCCTWPKIVLAVCFFFVSAIMIWVYAPIDELLDNVLPDFSSNNSTEKDLTREKEPTKTTRTGDDSETSPSPAPSVTTEEFVFMQCFYGESSNNCCNGLEGGLCDLRVDEILYAAVHNAMATFEDGALLGYNHLNQMEGALEEGYRSLNLDVCNCNGVLQFCHGFCNLGSRDVVEVITNVNSFLDEYRSEVLLITFQLNDDADLPIDLFDFYDLMDTVEGFSEKLYVHNRNDDWPTLRQVVDYNTRVLMFHYNGPRCFSRVTNSSTMLCPDGLHYWFEYAVETEFQFSSVEDLKNISLACNQTRGSGTFFGVNNFVTPSSQGASEVLNSYDFAKNHLEECSNHNNGVPVNLILADFWSFGHLPKLVQEHNTLLASGQGGRRTEQIEQRHRSFNLRKA